MRKFGSIVLLILFSKISLFSQQGSLKGRLTDTLEHKSLQNTVISLLKAKDSTLKYYTRAVNDGSFQFSSLDTGNYLLMISHQYFVNYLDSINIRTGTNEFFNFNMYPKEKLLGEVIVRNRKAMGMRSDTAFFTADSFKVKPGSNVEELLRKIPGIEVGRDGKITAMGEVISRVLVDGEEFFGTDPGIATKNLRADMINEVQVFDKKSEEEEFTGIRTGKKNKTINLTIKENKKYGYFGKLEGSGGIKDKFNNSVMLGSFQGKMKLAAYGLMSNTGQTEIGWSEAAQYGGMNDDVDLSRDLGSDDNFRSFSYDYISYGGIPTNWNGSIHFSNRFNHNKDLFNLGYKTGKVLSRQISSSTCRTFFKDSSWTNKYSGTYRMASVQHLINLNMESNIDTMTTIKWMIKAGQLNNNPTNISNGETRGGDGLLANSSNYYSYDDSKGKGLNSSLLFMHKFKKKSRTLMINAGIDLKENNSIVQGLNQFRYYQKGILERQDSTDRQTRQDGNFNIISAKIRYTEPIAKNIFLQFTYGINYATVNQESIVNNRNAVGKYIVKVDSLSNTYKFNRFEQRPALDLRYQTKKSFYSIGSGLGIAHFIRTDETRSIQRTYSYYNLTPNAAFNHRFKPSQTISISYQGNTEPPTIDQLQPILINSDQLNIYQGNPDLNQSFMHTFSTSYYSFSNLKRTNVNLNGSYTVTQNAIVSYSSIDSGITYLKNINADGVSNGTFYGYFSVSSKNKKWSMNLNPFFSLSRWVGFIAQGKNAIAVKNVSESYRCSIKIAITKNEENYSFSVGPAINYFYSSATINTLAELKYFQFEGTADGSLSLFKKWQLTSALNFRTQKKDPRFPANSNIFILNADIRRSFFKKNNLQISISAKDILNQNSSYYRSGYENSISETHSTILKRYFMLTGSWNFSKMGEGQ